MEGSEGQTPNRKPFLELGSVVFALLLVGAGFDVSGIANLPLAIVLWSAAAVLFAWAISHHFASRLPRWISPVRAVLGTVLCGVVVFVLIAILAHEKTTAPVKTTTNAQTSTGIVPNTATSQPSTNDAHSEFERRRDVLEPFVWDYVGKHDHHFQSIKTPEGLAYLNAQLGAHGEHWTVSSGNIDQLTGNDFENMSIGEKSDNGLVIEGANSTTIHCTTIGGSHTALALKGKNKTDISSSKISAGTDPACPDAGK